MQNLTPELAEAILQHTLPIVRNEHHLTQRVLKAIPHRQGDFRPDPIAMSAFELAWHIAAVEHMFFRGIATGQFQSGGSRPEEIKEPADVAAWHENTVGQDIEIVSSLKAEQLLKIVDFAGRMQLPALNYFTFALHHTCHHRGQLSGYLRPMGGKVPAIYGESYDSKRISESVPA